MPACAVATTEDLTRDPLLAARAFWVELPYPECHGARHAGIPCRFSGTPLRVQSAAPTLGQHTDEVLRGVLARSDADIARLRDAGVLQ